MIITVARYGGFCFGVRRAITLAMKTAAKNPEVCMLGDIVHNEDVIKQVEQAGIRRIKRLGKGGNKILLLSAHGTPTAVIEEARRRDYQIVDATCPMVKGIHNIARKMEHEGRAIIIVGDHDHDEVYGIIGQLRNRPIVIDRADTVPHHRLQKLKKAAVVVQSTQNAENVFKIIDTVKQDVPDLKFFNTICRPTRIRQAEMRTLPLENDVMIIIGSRTSANTQRLCEISHSLNSRTHCVESKRDLKPAWFKGARSVGVASGASTPDATIRDVVDYLRTLSK
jgi:4-hydroxy-3-methylbut-2-enyl diphosphate reductase